MIPNIVKGRGITGSIAYAMGPGNDEQTGKRKILKAGDKTRAEILGGQNFGYDIDSAERLESARRDMEWNGKAENQASTRKKCSKDCLHASLSWESGQNPTREEMVEAARGFLKALGMENAQAVFIAHNDTAHKHLHIIASRIDPETGKTFSQADDFSKGQAWSLQYEREHGQVPQNEARRNLHKIIDAIEARDGAALVENLTARTPTFTAREVDKALSYGPLSKAERAAFRGEILAQESVVGLRETPGGEVKRYTTREVLAAEVALLGDAQKLADNRSHGVNERRAASMSAAYSLKHEQAKALAHLTGAEGFAILWGEAGTGKSHTLNAARAVFEAEGKHVIGMAWTNDVVQQMRGDGFKNNSTIASELKRLDEGRTAWSKDTVLIVDEAAMLATAHLARLTAAAQHAGAKLILAGDDAQLASIERGGMFETLRQKHGAAVLEDVQRVKDAGQKAAFNQMHKGEFRDALATFEKAGGVHWADKQNDALRDMARRYTADSAAAPDKLRFMFAFTNAEVDALNAYAREVHRRRGELGADHTLATAHGEGTFATGDRIQFTGNGYGKSAKLAGLTNGRVGTITEIDMSGAQPRLTVALDSAKGQKPKEISFTVGEDGKAGEFDRFKHGYAGTIYRGQGRTLDQSYVCHSSQWRSSAAYVALTRHRESVEIFAARETVRGMDRQAERSEFQRAAAQATLDPAAFQAAVNAHDLDIMARGLARQENKRAASAYEIDEGRGAARAAEPLAPGIEQVAAAGVAVAVDAARQAQEPERNGDAREPPEGGIATYPAPSENAPAATTTRPIVAPEPETAKTPEPEQAAAPAVEIAHAAQESRQRLEPEAGETRGGEPSAGVQRAASAEGMQSAEPEPSTAADSELRSAGNIADAVLGGVGKAIGGALKAVSLLAGLFDEPVRLTPDEAKRNARAADEAARLAEFREHVAKRGRESSAIKERDDERQQERDRLGDDHDRGRGRDR